MTSRLWPIAEARGMVARCLRQRKAELRLRDVPAVALNVFGPNVVAQRLYATAGYELMSQQLRKELT